MQIAPSLFPRILRSGLFRTSVAIAILWAGGAMWNHHLNAPPVISIPSPAPLPVPNAFDDFVHAAALKSEPPDDAAYFVGTFRGKFKRSYTNTELSAFVTRANPAITFLRAGLGHAYRAPSYRTDGQYVPYTARFRSLARTLDFVATVQERKGDYMGATTTRLDGIQFGVLVPHGGSTFDATLGTALEWIVRRNLWADVDHLDADQATIAARRMEQISAMREPFSNSLAEEKWTDMTTLHDMLRKKSVVGFYEEFLQMESLANGRTPITPSKAENNRHRHLFFLMVTESKQQIADRLADALDRFDRDASQRFAIRRHVKLAPSDEPIVSLYLPAPSDPNTFNEMSIPFADDRAWTEDGLLTLDFALRAFRLRTGGYPESLDALVASNILHRLPEDPFAVMAGTTFRYHRLPNDRFLLYSIGPDCVDDGGKPVATLPERRSRILTEDSLGDWVVGVNTGAR